MRALFCFLCFLCFNKAIADEERNLQCNPLTQVFSPCGSCSHITCDLINTLLFHAPCEPCLDVVHAQPGCRCRDGYVWQNGECVLVENCPSKKSQDLCNKSNEHFSLCGYADKKCQPSCSTPNRGQTQNEAQNCSKSCDEVVCVCNNGYLRHDITQECIKVETCPNTPIQVRVSTQATSDSTEFGRAEIWRNPFVSTSNAPEPKFDSTTTTEFKFGPLYSTAAPESGKNDGLEEFGRKSPFEVEKATDSQKGPFDLLKGPSDSQKGPLDLLNSQNNPSGPLDSLKGVDSIKGPFEAQNEPELKKAPDSPKELESDKEQEVPRLSWKSGELDSNKVEAANESSLFFIFLNKTEIGSSSSEGNASEIVEVGNQTSKKGLYKLSTLHRRIPTSIAKIPDVLNAASLQKLKAGKISSRKNRGKFSNNQIANNSSSNFSNTANVSNGSGSNFSSSESNFSNSESNFSKLEPNSSNFTSNFSTPVNFSTSIANFSNIGDLSNGSSFGLASNAPGFPVNTSNPLINASNAILINFNSPNDSNFMPKHLNSSIFENSNNLLLNGSNSSNIQLEKISNDVKKLSTRFHGSNSSDIGNSSNTSPNPINPSPSLSPTPSPNVSNPSLIIFNSSSDQSLNFPHGLESNLTGPNNFILNFSNTSNPSKISNATLSISSNVIFSNSSDNISNSSFSNVSNHSDFPNSNSSNFSSLPNSSTLINLSDLSKSGNFSDKEILLISLNASNQTLPIFFSNSSAISDKTLNLSMPVLIKDIITIFETANNRSENATWPNSEKINNSTPSSESTSTTEIKVENVTRISNSILENQQENVSIISVESLANITNEHPPPINSTLKLEFHSNSSDLNSNQNPNATLSRLGAPKPENSSQAIDPAISNSVILNDSGYNQAPPGYNLPPPPPPAFGYTQAPRAKNHAPGIRPSGPSPFKEPSPIVAPTENPNGATPEPSPRPSPETSPAPSGPGPQSSGNGLIFFWRNQNKAKQRSQFLQ